MDLEYVFALYRYRPDRKLLEPGKADGYNGRKSTITARDPNKPMTEQKYEEGHCYCCGSTRADVVAEHKVEFHEHEFDAVAYYKVLECRGCGQHYFKTSRSNSEDYNQYVDPETGECEIEYIETVNYWPPVAKRRPPEWADDIGFKDRVLGSLFNDVYTALNNNLGVLAAIGMRTVFDRASEHLGIDPQQPFKLKLDDLKDGDHITDKQVAILAALIDAGSAATHRGWQPKPKQLDAMIKILEAFLHRAFLLQRIGAELGKGVPKRGPRDRKRKIT